MGTAGTFWREALSVVAQWGPRPTQVDIGIRATPPPILGDFGRVESLFGSFCPYDAVCFGFTVAREFRGYIRGHFAHTIQTDSPIRLACRPTANPTQNVDRISRLNRAGLIEFIDVHLHLAFVLGKNHNWKINWDGGMESTGIRVNLTPKRIQANPESTIHIHSATEVDTAGNPTESNRPPNQPES